MDGIQRFADRFALERFDIGRPEGGVYLTRYTLAGSRFAGRYAAYLHHFHRSDADDALHDHPWPFVSLILAGGYWEQTVRHTRWYGPGRVLVRPAEWRHRTILRPGIDCWTLILRGPKCRSWFFWCLDAAGGLTGKAVPWRSFLDQIEAGALGCGRTDP